MAVNAFDVLAAASVEARSKACNEFQRVELILSGFIIVSMGAVVVIRTLLAQKVHIAHLHFLDTIHFSLVIVAARGVHTLSDTITCNELVTIRGLVNRRRRVSNWRRWSSGFGGPRIWSHNTL
jgi:hypothetical protein